MVFLHAPDDTRARLTRTFHTLCSKNMTELLLLLCLAAKKKAMKHVRYGLILPSCRSKNDSSLMCASLSPLATGITIWRKFRKTLKLSKTLQTSWVRGRWLFYLHLMTLTFHSVDVLNGQNSEGQEVLVMVRAGCKSEWGVLSFWLIGK